MSIENARDLLDAAREAHATFVENLSALGRQMRSIDVGTYNRVDVYIGWDAGRDQGCGKDTNGWLDEIEEALTEAIRERDADEVAADFAGPDEALASIAEIEAMLAGGEPLTFDPTPVDAVTIGKTTSYVDREQAPRQIRASEREWEFAALPTGTSMNPASPEGATYYDRAQTAYVLFKTNENRTRPTRVFTSFGSLGWNVGDEIALKHDQTGAFLGSYRVTGIHVFATGVKIGEVPSIAIKHCVAK